MFYKWRDDSTPTLRKQPNINSILIDAKLRLLMMLRRIHLASIYQTTWRCRSAPALIVQSEANKKVSYYQGARAF